MPATSLPATVWDTKTHMDLLQSMVTVLKLNANQWADIIAETTRKGYTYSASAAQQHLQKLRRKETQAGQAASGSTPAKAESTPKRKRAIKNEDGTPSKKPFKGKAIKDETDSDEEKATKASIKKAASSKVKKEESSSNKGFNDWNGTAAPEGTPGWV